MKFLVITDQHHGGRKNASWYRAQQNRFYEQQLFPYIEENDIEVVIDLGDFWDNRITVDIGVIANAQKNYFDRMKSLDVELVMLAGNHDLYNIQHNDVYSSEILLSGYDNIRFVRDSIIDYDGGIVLCPWLSPGNTSDIMLNISQRAPQTVFGHFELSGFRYNKKSPPAIDKLDAGVFGNINIFSGHFHERQRLGNISYVGSCFQQSWADANCDRGFGVFDTVTHKMEYVDNVFTTFIEVPFAEFDADADYTDKHVRVIVDADTDMKPAQEIISFLVGGGVAKANIVDNVPREYIQRENIVVDHNDLNKTVKSYCTAHDIEPDVATLFSELYKKVCT
jgi:DNA repair exonuclease SbcCD nuclease subunit